MITEEKFGEYLKLERLGFEKCNDYEHYGQVYKMIFDDAIVYADFRLLNGNFKGISAHISFIKIENLINNLKEQYDIKLNRGIDIKMTITPTKLTHNIESALEKNRQAQEIHLKPENVQQVADMVYEYLTEVYKPFWEKYSSLQVVNDEIINKIDQMQLSDYIPFDMSRKKMIIMKLCNNPEYDNYIAWIDSLWIKRAETMDILQNNDYLLYQDLKNILNSGQLK